MDLDKFKKARPFLFHLTARANIARIRRSRRLQSTSELLQEAGRQEHSTQRRASHLRLSIGEDEAWLRDQTPLHARNIAFEEGWDLPRLVALLNARVFFWPGGASGPIESGRRHFEHYQSAGEDVMILRVPTSSLLDANAGNEPQLCRYNSGAPGGRGGPWPRGAATFQPASTCAFTPGEVKEVTFLNSVLLPQDTEMSPDGETWSRLL